MQGSGLSRMGMLIAILAVFLLLGCVMDSMAIILIFVPLFMPTLVAQGFDLVWFGIIVVVLTEIGLITPPVGMNVFVLKANLPKVPVGDDLPRPDALHRIDVAPGLAGDLPRSQPGAGAVDEIGPPNRPAPTIRSGETGPAPQRAAGAEGATAPETLRQKDRSTHCSKL